VSATEEDTALPHLPLLQLHFARDTPALLAHVRAHKALAFADWRSVDVPASERQPLFCRDSLSLSLFLNDTLCLECRSVSRRCDGGGK
jgi:hypothetical protein